MVTSGLMVTSGVDGDQWGDSSHWCRGRQNEDHGEGFLMCFCAYYHTAPYPSFPDDVS